MHLVPLLTGGAVDVDNVVASLIACMVQAAHDQQTLPEKRKRCVNNILPIARNQGRPWFEAEGKAAKRVKITVLHSDASEHEKKPAQ